MLRYINKILWKYFHVCIRIEKHVKYYKPVASCMVYAYNCFGHAEKCIYKNGKFLSLQDGYELKNIIRYTSFK